jgi:polysaccharide export outer membrane protein
MLGPRNFACALTLALLTAACSHLPAAGPTSQAIVDRAESPDNTVNFDYLLIDVTDPVVNALALRPIESLAKSFGVGGPAPLLVIGVGDKVDVTIWEAGPGGPFSSPLSATNSPGSRATQLPTQEVASDGMISIPYVGRIRVVGLKPADVEQLIVKGLTGKSVEPQAVVTVNHIGNQVSVTGEGTTGRRIPLSPNGDRVLDAIAAADGLKIPANEAWVRLTRGPKTVNVPYLAILANPRENVFLRSADILTVVHQPRTFTVFGATLQNKIFPFPSDVVTLEEAIASAGGLLDRQANPEGVFLFRFEPSYIVRKMVPDQDKITDGIIPVVYRLNFRDAGSYFLAREFEVRDKDIIYVSDHPLTDFQKFLAIVYGALGPAAAGAAEGYVLAR